MYTFVELAVEDLQVSTTNPRFVQIVMNENFAIAKLIDLEINKMTKLVKSVVDKGLLPLTFYCFKENGGVVLADGNRRLTVLKILQNPKLIPENTKNKELIDICKSVGAIDLPHKIPCVIYDEWSDELFDILNSLHVTDESKSDWTPLAQYRMSSRHGGNKHSWMKTLLCYFSDNEVDLMTNRKADVFRRMFDAIKSNKIQILENGEIDIINAREKLKSFCKLIKNGTVNTRSEIGEFQNRVKQIFINDITPLHEKYSIIIRKDYLYESQGFSLNKLGLEIRNEGGKIVNYTEDIILYHFKNPYGEETKEFISLIGQWELIVEYEGFKKNLKFDVIEKKETKIVLNGTKISVTKGDSAYLRNYIVTATNAFNEDVKSKVKIKAVKGQNIKIENDTLSGDLEENTYIIQYYYKDNYGECSKILYVQVTHEKDFYPLKGEVSKTNLLSWGNIPVTISYDNTVSALINEINKLDFAEFPNIISCSCRAIIELSYDMLLAHGKINPNNGKIEFINKIELIVQAIKSNLSNIVNGAPKIFNSFHDEQNFLNSFNEGKLKSINWKLNSAAHKSGKNVNLSELEECIKKDIARIVVLINQILK